MSTTHTSVSQRAAEYLGYQLALHPRLRRATTLWLTTHTLLTCAVLAAPPALAAPLSGALNWTGITDSHHVPIGNYYLSIVSTTEAITKAGPGLSANPASWAKWLANAVTTGVSHESICAMLQLEAAGYIFLMALALWLLKFSMSNTWLAWLATWMRPLFATIQKVLSDVWFFPLCLLAGLAVGAFHMVWHGRRGHGAGIMLSAFAMGVLGMLLTGNPLSDLYNENGLISQGRNLGFTLAQAGFNNGPLSAGGATGQLQHLTGLIADATVRMPLQLMNFGTPVDNIGSCGQAYTTAMLNPTDAADAAHQMAHCGAPGALTYAQHLSGENLAVGGAYALLGTMFAAFVCYVTYSYVMVCTAAFINALLSVVAAGTAMVHGQPRRRAIRRFTMMFKHAALVFAYTTYISVAAIILLKMASVGGYADQIGMTHPLARLLMVAITSVAAIAAFRWLKHELGDHTRHDLTHTVTDLHHKGREGYQRGQNAYQHARDLNSRAPWSTNSSTPGGADTSDPGADPDNPLTGTPVQGRPPGGRPPGPTRSAAPQRAAGRPAQSAAGTDSAEPVASTGATGSATGAGATAAAGEAAATVLAPEVVGAVVVARAATSHLRGGTQAGHPPASRPAAGPRNAIQPDARRRDRSVSPPAGAAAATPRRGDEGSTTGNQRSVDGEAADVDHPAPGRQH